MADEPVIIKGGSLTITIRTRKGDINYSHPTQTGTLTSVDINGQNFPVNNDTQITIHYDVPNNNTTTP